MKFIKHLMNNKMRMNFLINLLNFFCTSTVGHQRMSTQPKIINLNHHKHHHEHHWCDHRHHHLHQPSPSPLSSSWYCLCKRQWNKIWIWSQNDCNSGLCEVRNQLMKKTICAKRPQGEINPSSPKKTAQKNYTNQSFRRTYMMPN